MTNAVAAPERPWAVAAEQVTRALSVPPRAGLATGEVSARRQRYGPNSLRRGRHRSTWRIVADQFTNLIVALLAAASLAAFVFIDWIDGTAIAVVLLINAAIGFFTEWRAVRTMESLYRLGQVTARVRRDGEVQQIPASELVPGDIVLVEGGDVVTADMRLLDASRLQADESALTGESVPVAKSTDPVDPGTVLAERACMLYKGTAVTRGSAVAVVVATGLATELGRITQLVEATEAVETPLDQRLKRLAQRLIVVTLALAAAVGLAGIGAGRDPVLMLETAIALAVATVPEGLPVVATIALARGLWRMAQHNALVSRLSAVETLGATSVICTDKTGTLTENRMVVARLLLPSGQFALEIGEDSASFARGDAAIDPATEEGLREALEIGVLCNNAEAGAGADHGARHGLGDPMEVALLEAGAAAGIGRRELLDRQPEEREEAFDPEAKRMATFHRVATGLRVAVKGAPEVVIGLCAEVRSPDGASDLDDAGRRQWLDSSSAMAGEGLRVLALATREARSVDESPYDGLVLLGLAGLVDPPREEVRRPIERCRAAGVRVVMVTGDHGETARYVAKAVGLVEDESAEVLPGERLRPPEELDEDERERLREARIFARVEPAQKLNLIALHQAGGHIVAMTGDGVNDAPALKKADIGIAMGQRGTDVAREAAAMVLLDDAFQSIVLAIEQGRVIFSNIRRFVLYLLSCNVSELLVVALATVASAPLPILPLQILFLNVVTDVFPALALGVGASDGQVMEQPPRPSQEAILTRRHWLEIAVYGSLITVAVLGAFACALLWLGLDEKSCVTVSFLTLALAQLGHVFNMRDPEAGALHNDVVRNPYVWAALLLCLALLAAAAWLPPLANVLQVAPLEPSAWGVVLGFAATPLAAGQLWLALRGVKHPARRAA